MAADTITSRAPDARFLVGHPAHFIALGFGAGLAPKAPGTFGTLVAFPIYWALATVLPFFFLGLWESHNREILRQAQTAFHSLYEAGPDQQKKTDH